MIQCIRTFEFLGEFDTYAKILSSRVIKQFMSKYHCLHFADRISIISRRTEEKDVPRIEEGNAGAVLTSGCRTPMRFFMQAFGKLHV